MVLSDGFFLGFDIGSVSLNTVVMNKNKEIIEEHYTRTMGEPLKVLHDMLVDLDARISLERAEMISFTGTGTKSVAPLLDAPFVNEIIAHTRAVEEFYPTVNTVIEMGGEDSKLILLSKDDNPARNKITDFAMNSICAAGTGSFLDQQAQRLGLSIEEFSRLALKSENPPRIAGRCSVFAKSDMIHLQQVATPDYDIIAGLCFAVARNFKGNIAKGKHIIPPVVFQGGVAANVGVVKAFRSVLELSDNELIIPRYFASMGAIGTALISMEKGESYTFPGLTKLIEFLNAPLRTHGYLKTLKPTNNHALYNKCFSGNTNKKEKIDAYLGLDVGSISTNVVVIDREKRVLAKRYLMTAGRPIEAIKTGLLEVGNEVKDTVIIRGVGTTGSGRYLTGDFIGADLVKNEITAQASAAIHIDRDVDTIFEIGGQDSKYISIKDGTIIDFEMNKVCAAGTGSFLEEQAERLGISIKEEFASLAFSSLSPVQLGERCTVFMESDVLRNMEGGTKKEDIVAGLCYSIVYNYLNKVVGDKKIGERIFFQGGTAFNKGVVSAFEQVLNVPIIVPEHHEVTGAMGVAILAMEEMDKNENKTQFKGFDLTKKSYDLTTFECQDCPNMCEVKKLTVSGEKPLFYGSRCEKYDIGKKNKIREDIADLFSEREKTLVRSLKNQKQTEHDSEVIGIPRLLTFFEFMPFWITFFSKLGFKVELSDKTNKKIIRSGAELVVAETCFPVKVAHGHIQNLIDKGIKKIFVPSIINLPSLNSHDQSFTCPYVQAFPFTVRAAFDFEQLGVEVLSPVLHLIRGEKWRSEDIKHFSQLLRIRPKKMKQVLSDAMDAQKEFQKALLTRGKETIESLKPDDKAVVILSRPYNGCDPAINLDISKKLMELGVTPLPMDSIPIDGVDMGEDLKDMYWRYGQRIIATTEVIKHDPRLLPIYITNFACGPDSFIIHFVSEQLKGKPWLLLEIDEHSADAGVVTRLEAFLDSIKGKGKRTVPVTHTHKVRETGIGKQRKVFIPYMSDHAFVLASVLESCGILAEVMPESDDITLSYGRKYTSGRECYPCILTTGDMIKVTTREDFNEEKAAFFMPAGDGPCRFGQYNRLHQFILNDLGLSNVPIISPIQDENLYEEVQGYGKDFTRRTWEGIVCVDLMNKLLHETRPYELKEGQTDEVYDYSLKLLCENIKQGNGIKEVLKEAKGEFAHIAVDKARRFPVVGIVGEIYIRSNRFANENLIRKLEKLGAEVWLAPFGEWIFYINYTGKRRAFNSRRFKNYLKTSINNWVQGRIEHELGDVFHSCLNTFPEPTTEEILKMASRYMHSAFEGEAILSVGKSIDLYGKGVGGIVNAMPFTCMPGTIVSAVLKRFKEDHDGIPIVSMVYDGQGESNNFSRLEAFMYQVKQYHEENRGIKLE